MSLLLNMKQKKKNAKTNTQTHTHTHVPHTVQRRKPANGAEWMIGDSVHGVPIHAGDWSKSTPHRRKWFSDDGNFTIKRLRRKHRFRFYNGHEKPKKWFYV